MRMGTKKALVVVDMLNDFVLDGAPLQVPDTKKIIGPIKSEIQKAREENTPVIYVCDSHDKDDPEFTMYPPHAIEGEKGSEVIDELEPEEGDYVVKKKTLSSFFNTKLDDLLKKLDVGHLVVCGTVTNICVLYAVADARVRGYDVTVLKDCVAGLDPQDHEFALRQMEEVFKAEVV